VLLGLRQMFGHRHRVTKSYCEQGPKPHLHLGRDL
jgi:hypothetical protein